MDRQGESIGRRSSGRELAEIDKPIKAQQAYIDRRAQELELIKAFGEAGAIDVNGDGSYADLIALTRGRLKVTQDFDAAGKLVVSTIALDADGNPMVTADGAPLGAAAIAAEFLAVRPALVKKGFVVPQAAAPAPTAEQLRSC